MSLQSCTYWNETLQSQLPAATWFFVYLEKCKYFNVLQRVYLQHHYHYHIYNYGYNKIWLILNHILMLNIHHYYGTYFIKLECYTFLIYNSFCCQSIISDSNWFIMFFFLIYLFIYIYDCVGSLFLCEGFLQLLQVGATLHRGARASHYRGLSCCGAQAPDAQAQ